MMKSTSEGRFRIFLIFQCHLNSPFEFNFLVFCLTSLFLCIQVIVEKAPKARIGDLDKKKYLVPSDLTGKRSFRSSVLFH